MPSTASVNDSVNAFRSDLNNEVEGMWLDHDICVVQILGKTYAQGDLVGLLHSYVIIKSIGEYEEEVDYEESQARLGGFLSQWNTIQVVKIDKFEPARVGWGAAQNQKVRKHAVALSVLVPHLLDKCGGKCQNEFVSSFCAVAATKRPRA